MIRYLIIHNSHFVMLISSSASVLEIESALKLYLADDAAVAAGDKYINSKSTDTSVPLDGDYDDDGAAFIMFLKGHGHMVGPIAKNVVEVNDFFEKNYTDGAYWLYMLIDGRQVGANNMYDGAKDTKPITVATNIYGTIEHIVLQPKKSKLREHIRKIVK